MGIVILLEDASSSMKYIIGMMIDSQVLLYHKRSTMLLVIIIICRDEKAQIKLPTSLEDAKSLGLVLTKYRKDHYYQVLSAYFLSYVLYPFNLPIMQLKALLPL